MARTSGPAARSNGARLSTRLLETPGVGEGERAYLAVNAVAALTALGERAKAREVVQRQAPALSARDRERLLVRTAFAAAFEGPR